MPSACASASASQAWRIQAAAVRGAAGRCRRSIDAEVVALEVLHDHVRRAVLERADVEHARDVLALELAAAAAPRGRSARATSGFCSAVGQEELDRDALLELEVRRRDDDAHAALPEDALDAVLADEDCHR